MYLSALKRNQMVSCLTSYLLKAKFIQLYFIAAYEGSLWSALSLLQPREKEQQEQWAAHPLFLQFKMSFNLALLACFLLWHTVKMTRWIPTWKSAQTQEHLEVSSSLKATCYFPQTAGSVHAVFPIMGTTMEAVNTRSVTRNTLSSLGLFNETLYTSLCIWTTMNIQ